MHFCVVMPSEAGMPVIFRIVDTVKSDRGRKCHFISQFLVQPTRWFFERIHFEWYMNFIWCSNWDWVQTQLTSNYSIVCRLSHEKSLSNSILGFRIPCDHVSEYHANTIVVLWMHNASHRLKLSAWQLITDYCMVDVRQKPNGFGEIWKMISSLA